MTINQSLAEATRTSRLMQAADAMNQGQPAVAERLLKDFLFHQPANVVAIRMLAELANRLGRVRDAEALLRRTLALAPEFHTARVNLATLLYRTGRPGEALSELEFLKFHADGEGQPGLRAAVLNKLGHFEEAIALYRACLANSPQRPEIMLALGHTLKTVGQTEQGVEAYRQAIGLRPAYGEAWWSLANLKTFRFSNVDREAMLHALATNGIGEEDRFHLEFALGKASEDLGEAEAAFAWYKVANAHRRALAPYHHEHTSREVDGWLPCLTPQFFAARAALGHPTNAPIFIVGLPRSGSTLIEQILSSHSMIEPTDELPDMPRIVARLGPTVEQRAAALASFSGEEIREMADEYLASVALYRQTDRPYFIDKLPNNWLHIAVIRVLFPHSKIIDSRRNLLSCGFSNFRQHYARGHLFSYDLEDIGRYYCDYRRMLAAAERALPGYIHRIDYEAMVYNSAVATRHLLEWLEVPFEPSCLDFYTSARPVRTPSSEQVRQPIFKEGVDNWKPFDSLLKPLKTYLTT